MRRLIPALLGLLVLIPAGRAGEPPKDQGNAGKAATPEQQYKALLQDYNKHFNDFLKEYRQAKDDEARQKLIKEKLPKAPEYAKKFLKLGEEHPTSPAAAEALAWVVMNVRFGPDSEKALTLLLKNHIKSDQMGTVAQMLAYMPSAQNEKALRQIIKENPHADVQGKATYALGQMLKSQHNEKAAEKEFETAIAKYGDIKLGRRTLADAARGELFEIRHLSIGKVAPNITGEDADGKKFQLTDYRGKVVVLDFWGEW